MKGVLRRVLEEIADHLERLGIARRSVIEKIFGPLTPMTGEASPAPCRSIFGPLYPIENLEIASKLAQLGSLEYLYQGDYIASPRAYVEPHVRIDDVSGRVATGAFFKELRVFPRTTFYGEIVHYAEDRNQLVESARALLVAIASLRYRYVGRKTLADSYVVSIEPPDLLNDPLINYVLTILKKRASG